VIREGGGSEKVAAWGQILYKTIGSVYAEQNTRKALSLASDFLGRPLIIFYSLELRQSSKGSSTPPEGMGIYFRDAIPICYNPRN
jgi:hypothetical protein